MTKYCTSCCKTSTVTCKMLLNVVGARIASKVATEVVGLLLVEVLVADGVDVVDVLSVFVISTLPFSKIFCSFCLSSLHQGFIDGALAMVPTCSRGRVLWLVSLVFLGIVLGG